MGWTKRQLIEEAFSKIGMASYNYDLQPEMLQSALYQLDSMLATWNNKNIQLGYPLSTSPQNVDLDTETEIPDRANEAIFLNLAIRLAPNYGKQLMPEIKRSAYEAYQGLLQISAFPREMQFPSTLPRGAGNKSYRDNQSFTETPYGPYQPWDE